MGYKEFAITNSFKDGRIFTGIAVLIAHVTNVPIKISVSIMLFIALVISNIIVIIIKNIVEKYILCYDVFRWSYLHIIKKRYA